MTDKQGPAIFEISPQDGSAYYITESAEYGVELVQVPLLKDNGPDWERGEEAWDFGGGSVDWYSAFEDNAEGQAAKERLKAIEKRLVFRHRLADFKAATRSLNTAWDEVDGDIVVDYPDYLPSFDSFALDVQDMEVEHG